MDSLSTDSFDFLKDKEIITNSAKQLLSLYPFKNILDANMLHWWMHNKPIDDDIKVNTIDIMNNRFYNLKNINTVIPIYKHLEYCNALAAKIQHIWEKRDKINFTDYLSYNKEAILAFYSIERKGKKVSNNIQEVFDSRVGKHMTNNKLYSDYFLYTATGRPSNSFGNVNFAALDPPKREVFIPENDLFVEMDYDAYHLRLIADMINYKFPEGSVHEYLAGWYGVDYKESKAITFKILYGGIGDEIADKVPFFKKVRQFIYLQYKLFNKQKYIETPIYNRRIMHENFQDMNANYDGFLFDYSNQDGEHVLHTVRKIMERNNHPVKIKQGLNYKEMQ